MASLQAKIQTAIRINDKILVDGIEYEGTINILQAFGHDF